MIRTRTRYVVGLPALAWLALWACDARTVLAQAKKSDAVVTVSATTGKTDAEGKQTVTITLNIDKPWHIYANPVENEDLANVQTVVSIASKGKLDSVKVAYPSGKLQRDKGVTYKTYEGKVTIKVEVKRGGGNNSPLEVSVKLQACNEKTCLFPVTIKKELP